MLRRAALIVSLCAWVLPSAAFASNCYAFVQGVPGVRYVALDGPILAAGAREVTITYVGHSTFRIETEGGVVIATDFFGASGEGRLPDVVTMNKAHETHFTDFPNPDIPNVMRGWNPKGGPAKHLLELNDVVIRNVTTDIRGWGSPEKDANSIFVFEVADLCIGHLGHLHHDLTEAHHALLGRLDIVMAPVDGSFTLDIGTMTALLKRLKARLVLPMHAFGQYSLERFLDGMRDEFDVAIHDGRTIKVSLETLPSRPTVLVLPTVFPLDYD
ncbi:MAG: MBL fold metallo-hydrolase [Paracoccaceae bacterium]|nr:MBL fold metallo-hydrolase [Paracoccaceae bacterium]